MLSKVGVVGVLCAAEGGGVKSGLLGTSYLAAEDQEG